jgi:hypothetical protein
MILRKLVKKFLHLDESSEVTWLQKEVQELTIERNHWKGQANVDATENLYFKQKIQKVRMILGEDDECFSKFSRDQIRDMSIEEFRKVEAEIDKDVANGKLFLQ